MALKLPLNWARLRPTFVSRVSPLILADCITSSRSFNGSTHLPRICQRGKRTGPGWSTLSKRNKWHDRYNKTPELPEKSTGPAAALKRKEQSTPLRCGVLAVKKGMTAVYQHGKRLPCTVLQLEGVTVIANKTFEKHGYWAVQVGAGWRHPSNVKTPQLGYYEAKGVRPMRHLSEFKVRYADGLLPVGVELWPDWFHKGQYVDARSTSRGMGFAGGMKRHGFAGQEASHGNSRNHRTIGTAGPSQGSGSRVLPGKKMPGRMGGQRVTVQNLQVLGVDNNLGTILVKGAISGPKGSIVKVQDAIKKRPPYPAHMKEMKEALDKRFPHAQFHLWQARARHLELKKARRDGNIIEILRLEQKEREEKDSKLVNQFVAQRRIVSPSAAAAPTNQPVTP